MAIGRPTKYRPEFCEALIKHMSSGYSFESFAAKINTDRSQLYRWTERYPAFRDAHKKAKEQCQFWWETLGMGGTTGKVEGFNVAAWIFNMKNRFSWGDRIGIDHSGSMTNTTLLTSAEKILSEPKTLEAARLLAEACSADETE
jgi:transposase